MTSLIWLIVAVLVVMWLLGFSFHIGGTFIFLLLLLAAIAIAFNLASGMGGGHHHHVVERDVDHVDHIDHVDHTTEI